MNEQERQLRDRTKSRLVNLLNQLKRDMASEGYATEHLTVDFVFGGQAVEAKLAIEADEIDVTAGVHHTAVRRSRK